MSKNYTKEHTTLSSKKPKQKQKQLDNYSKLPSIAFFIAAGIVPIIVRLAFIALPDYHAELALASFRQDQFSYHKSWVLIVAAVMLIFHAISEQVIGNAKKFDYKALLRDPVIIITAVYLLFVIVSNIFSPYTHTAMLGLYDRREGLFVQLAYITLFIGAIFYVQERKGTGIILIAFLFSSTIMGLIGFSQFINRDFFATYFAGWLVTGMRARLTPIFWMAYGTNFNPNTFGKVTAMLTPVLFASAIIHKNWILRGLFLFAGTLMLIGIIASASVGGIVGGFTAVTAIVTTLVLHFVIQRIKRRGGFSGLSKRALAITGIAIVVAITGTFVLRGHFYDNLSFTLGRVASIFEAPDVQLDEYNFEGNVLHRVWGGHEYSIIFPHNIELEPPVVVLPDGNVIEPTVAWTGDEENPILVFTYPGILDSPILLRDDPHVNLMYMYRGFRLVVENGRLYMIHRLDQRIDPNEPIPSFGFEGWETWGSNRGFIFARTIPLLRDSLIIGSGSDTFKFRFPQHDLVSIARYFGAPNTLIDKAHNLYLQTAITTGMISAIALIALFGYYILSTFKMLLQSRKMDWLRLGILAAVSAYSVSSLATDSTVSSAPMFWIILGMGFALNRLELGVRK